MPCWNDHRCHSGNTIADLDKVGWHGNIREFTRDYYDESPKTDATDPTGPKDGDPKNHVVRGGAYSANAATALNCRSAVRRPTESLAITGFRVLVTVDKP